MLEIRNPADGSLLRRLEADSAAAISAKAARARAFQGKFAALPFAERKAQVAAFGALLKKERDSLARTLTSETGKPITQSRNELDAMPGRMAFFLENAQAAAAEREVFKDSSVEERITFEPLGVVANISAWNYPYFVGSNVFLPALLTGNAVLYKPSEFASLTGLEVERLMREARVPEDAFQTVIGTGEAGAKLLKQPLDAVFFTGSRDTGLEVAQAAAEGLMKVQLELGGKDPVYVTDDVDAAAAAAAAADGAFYNNGQSCCAVERLYVHEAVYGDFLDAFLTAVRGFQVGDPMEESTYIGPLTREAQIGVLEGQVKDAVAKGARLLAGGKRMDRPGNWFEPAVLDEADHSMSLMREESFGPVLGIMKVRGDEEALALANDTTYGLTAGVYCRDFDRARAFLARVDAGTAYVNCCDRVSPRLPWSGRGDSGLGATLSVLGIETFLKPKAWHIKP